MSSLPDLNDLHQIIIANAEKSNNEIAGNSAFASECHADEKEISNYIYEEGLSNHDDSPGIEGSDDEYDTYGSTDDDGGPPEFYETSPGTEGSGDDYGTVVSADEAYIPPEFIGLASIAASSGDVETYQPSPEVKFRPTRRDRPCPICEKMDWCSISQCGNWANCKRLPSHSAFGEGKEKKDKNGETYYSFRLTAKPTRADAWKEALHSHQSTGGKLADPDTLNLVYRAILAKLPLTDMHKSGLRERGLVDGDQLIKQGYRSLYSTWRFLLLSAHLVSKFGELRRANKSTFVNRGRDAEEAQKLALQG
jgi:hypothetical protein